MINKAPIFINGFTRGGTNILMNLVVSHPDVCMLGGEMQVIFYGKQKDKIKKWGNMLLYLPILLATRQHYFWPYRLYPRRTMPKFLFPYIDLLLFMSKLLADWNRIRDEFSENTMRQIASSRLVGKNVNGVVLTTPMLAELYPDAVFVALVRNGLALANGFMRRGWSAERFANMYEIICQQMLTDAQKIENYIFVRFEDLIDSPAKVLKGLYPKLGLDIGAVDKFRLQAKKSMLEDGTRQYTFGGEVDREIQWFQLSDLHQGMRKDVNKNQIARLSDQDKHTIMHLARKSLVDLGYLDGS